MQSVSKEHNKSKRRRRIKAMLRVLRNPQKRETLIRELAIQRSPLRNMTPAHEVE